MKKTKERKVKSYKGITLIALVVTIVVLLILAGVSISMLAGENGIIKQAKNAKISTEIANEKELIKMAIVSTLDPNKTERTTVEEIKKAMDSIVGENTSIVLDNGETIVIKFENSERYYEVDEKGNIQSFIPYKDTTPGELALNNEGIFMIESIEDLVVFSAMQNGGYSDEYISISSNRNIDVVLMRNLDFKSPLSYDDCTTTIYNGYLGIEDKNTTLIEALTNTEKYKGFIPIADENHIFSRNI